MPGSRFWVAALNALQNSMMLSPRWPSAGPIGGDGFALPAGTCSLIRPTIFLAIYVSNHRPSPQPSPRPRGEGEGGELDLFNLRIFQLDRGGATEDRDRDLETRALLVDILDQAVERGEGPVADPDLLADLKGDRRLRAFDSLLHLVHDARRLVLADRRRTAAAAEKTGDLCGVLDEVPGVVAEIHLDQHIAGKELALRADLGAALDLDDLLGRHENLLELLRQPLLLGLLADRRGDFFLKARIDVYHIPAARHLQHPEI